MTSNLIAFWKMENENRARENEYLLAKVKEARETKAMELAEKWNNLNYQLQQANLRFQEMASERNYRIALMNAQTQQAANAIENARVAEMQRSNLAKEAADERKRVTESYNTQRAQNIQSSYNSKMLAMKGAELALEGEKLKVQKSSNLLRNAIQGVSVVNGLALGIANLALQKGAYNDAR